MLGFVQGLVGTGEPLLYGLAVLQRADADRDGDVQAGEGGEVSLRSEPRRRSPSMAASFSVCSAQVSRLPGGEGCESLDDALFALLRGGRISDRDFRAAGAGAAELQRRLERLRSPQPSSGQALRLAPDPIESAAVPGHAARPIAR